MMVTRFSKKKDHPCFTKSCVCFANQRPVLEVRVGVSLNNETDLALTIHFHLPNTE